MSLPRRLTREVLLGMPLPALPAQSDKNTRGRLLVVGGGAEVPGAAILSVLGALRAGAGKVQTVAGAAYAAQLACALPEARVIPVPTTDRGEICPSADLGSFAAQVDAVIVGPGMLEETGAATLAARLAAAAPDAAFLIDAAALTGLSGDANVSSLAGRLVITPHAGEMASFLGLEMETIQADPLAAARRAAANLGAVVVMKGVESHVVTPDGAAWLFDGGCRGLGVSGSGDVLAGVIGGLLARGASPLAATLWGVWLHGAAGCALSETIGPLGFLARELPGQVPALLSALSQET